MSVALSSVSAFVAASATAREVDFAAYTLRPGTVRESLIAAVRAGARVRVRLERDPLDDPAGTLHAANAQTVAQLRAAGADAALTAPDAPVLHLKGAVVDGVAWLDDCNWAGDRRETVLRDSDPADVAALRRALAAAAAPADGGASPAGCDPGPAALATCKGAALRLETELIRSAGGAPLAVESESFGGGDIYDAVLARARQGLPTRLLVAGREAASAGSAGSLERSRLTKLAALGVSVRIGDPAADLDEKLALAATGAWAGSANATYAWGADGEQRDWGLRSNDSVLVDALRAAFERNWNAAHPLGDATLAGTACAPSSATTSSTRPPARNSAPPSSSASTSR